MAPSMMRRTSELSGPRDRTRYVIGRSTECDLVINDPTVSRRHAELQLQDADWVLTDLGSRAGTSVNGSMVAGPTPLRLGDQIGVGLAVVIFDARPEHTGYQPETLPAPPPDAHASATLVGDSPAMVEVRRLIDRIAPTMASVLILGESGTGKELVARLLHERSERATRPFVVVNCPALPGGLIDVELFGVERRVATEVDPRPGRLESAAGGTLFLDEIGDLELAAQAKLLRFLQDKTVERIGGREPIDLDVRILAATNHNLEDRIARGGFRLDLYHRLRTLTVRLPALRQRPEDIPALLRHFIGRSHRPDLEFSDAAVAALQAHGFPGNVRELERIVVAASILAEGPRIEVTDLSFDEQPLHDDETATVSESTPTAAAAVLHARLLAGDDFWELVHQPFLRRELSTDVARATIAAGLRDTSGNLRELGRRYGIDDPRTYKKMADFLRNHGLVDR